MNKFIKTTWYFLISIGLVIMLKELSFAQTLPVPDVGQYGGVVQDPGNITDFEGGVASLIVGAVLNVRYLLTAITIALMIYSGFNMVIAQGQEEAWTKAKTSMVWGVVGLALVGLSGEIVRIFAVGKCAELGMLPASNYAGCVEGGFLKNPQAIIQRSTIFNKGVQYLITFIKYMIGGFAVLSLTRNAIRMAANTAGEELEKDKKNLAASAIGLFLIIVADPIINNVFFSIDTTRYPGVGGAEAGVNVAQGVGEIVGFTNFLVTIITPIAILVIIAGGIMYMTAGSNAENQERAKKMIFMALLALIIIYGAFAIVSTVISGQFDAATVSNPAAAVEGIGQRVTTPNV